MQENERMVKSQALHPELAEATVMLTVAAVARRLGVAPATLRTWDRRYGIGPSEHDSGQNRLYTLTDVARLDYMRNLVVQGLSPNKAAQIAKDQNVQPASLQQKPVLADANRSAQLTENIVDLDSPRNTVRGLLRAANMLDSAACNRIIGNLLDSKGVLWTWDNVLIEALKAVGEKWELTGQGIEVEHLLADSIESQLRIISTSVFDPINARPVILACTAHELHTLPMFAIAAGLAEHKISSRILGARLPADSLLAAAKKVGPSAVLVWSQTRGTAEPDIWQALLQQRPAPVLVAAGPGWLDHEIADVVSPQSLNETLMILATSVGRI
jgi:DNA-binding transcriptional MerR regulator